MDKPLEEYKPKYKNPHLELNDLEPEQSPNVLKIQCPSCQHAITAANLNINDKIGKCDSCNSVFSFANDVQGLMDHRQKVRQEILRPEQIELFYFRDELELSFRRTITVLETILLSIIGFITLIGVSVMLKHGFKVRPFIAILTPVLLTAIYALFRRKHKVYITVDPNHLNIIYKPHFFQNEKSYHSRDIKQIYIKKRPDVGIWNVMMIIENEQGHKHIRLTSVNSVSKAKFLEQEIEKKLGIIDTEVPEED